MILVGVLALIGNIFLISGIRSAPNQGYALSVAGLSTVLVGLISVFIFKSELTLITGLGILFAIVSIILFSL